MHDWWLSIPEAYRVLPTTFRLERWDNDPREGRVASLWWDFPELPLLQAEVFFGSERGAALWYCIIQPSDERTDDGMDADFLLCLLQVSTAEWGIP